MPAQTINSRIAEGAAYWASYYRHNVWRFVRDYLHIELKLFQKILLTMMMVSTAFAFIAARGIGKTYLSAIYAVCRCILYPGTKVCVASGVRSQGIAVVDKIRLELIPNARELEAEIDSIKINGTTCDDTFDTVLRKFLTQQRMPRYSALTKEEREREYAKEKNITMYLTSAYWEDSWIYQKCRDILKNMMNDRRQFVCGFPYQLSIEEGLLDREIIEDEMSETDFSEVKFSMEYCAEFYGSAEDAFFDFDSISKNRKIRYPMMPDAMAAKLGNSQSLKIPPKQNGEIRILSADIALMSSKKHNNDATAIFINQMMPAKSGRYMNNIVYTQSAEGLRTEAQALMVRKLFDEYACDWLVLDANGIGLGVYDCLARDIVDPDTGEIYPALSCYNDSTMADRCTVIGAPKVIWSIKASAQFNSDCAFMLREGFRSGRVRLLVSEYDADEALSEIRGWASLNPPEQMKMKLPYINTTLLIDELVNLQHEETGGRVKIFEKAGMRKDRYSSLAYNYYVAIQLENRMGRRNNANASVSDLFVIKAPKSYNRKAVSRTYGGNRQKAWY